MSDNSGRKRSHKTPTRKYEGNLKSPMQKSSEKKSKVTETDVEDQLEEENRKLDAEIKKLQEKGYEESELQVHIDKLHEYNEIKDVGQMVLGRLATLGGVTSKDLYEKYDLNQED